MKVRELIEKIRTVTDEYIRICATFSMVGSKDVGFEWELYIADVTSKTGNAFPKFSTFAQLESFVNILVLELKRVHKDAVKNAVENAVEILKAEEKKEGK